MLLKGLPRFWKNEKNSKIVSLRSDNGENHDIKHNFLSSRTPQQNGVVERKNRSLEQLAQLKIPILHGNFLANLLKIFARKNFFLLFFLRI